MSSQPDVAARVIAVFSDTKRVPAESITPATTLAELRVDSLDALNIAFALEEALHISIPDEDLRNLKTVGDAIAGVERLLAARPGEAAQAS